MSRHDIIVLVNDFLKVDAEIGRATYSNGVTPALLRKHGELSLKLRTLINSELGSND